MSTIRPPKRLAALFVTALTAAAFWTPVADATYRGTNGRLVSPTSTGLATLKVNGSGLRRLGVSGDEPAWSPDGGRIAYRNGALFVINANGTGKDNLGIDGQQPAWSPDGTQIAFAAPGGISVVNDDGSGFVDLTDGLDSEPQWSPDGSQIAFIRYDTPSTSSIWVMDSDGGNEAELFDDGGRVTSINWSPDGSKLVFTSGGQIWVVDSNGQNPTQLTFAPDDGASNGAAFFSPNGSLIGFFSSRASGFWTMNADGSNQVRRNTVGGSDWQPLQLTLTVSKTKVKYNGAVTLTAHLFEATSNNVVSIYAKPHGEEAQLVLSQAVDSAGDLVKAVHVPRLTTFYATWSGDATHLAGGISESRKVQVFARLTDRLLGYDRRSGGYKLYDYTSACPNRGRGCPKYEVSIAPNHAGQRVFFTLQIHVNGRWRTVLDFGARIPASNTITQIFVYSNRSVVGLPTRVRARFKGDADHLATRTDWAYFKVV